MSSNGGAYLSKQLSKEDFMTPPRGSQLNRNFSNDKVQFSVPRNHSNKINFGPSSLNHNSMTPQIKRGGYNHPKLNMRNHDLIDPPKFNHYEYLESGHRGVHSKFDN